MSDFLENFSFAQHFLVMDVDIFAVRLFQACLLTEANSELLMFCVKLPLIVKLIIGNSLNVDAGAHVKAACKISARYPTVSTTSLDRQRI